jgi:23S rRNA (cytidine1920-2'-O)/16S rRNA (cytidine1409-2'-O)-methyltransferase
LVALVKPQFEVGPDHVGKGGIVRDEAVRADALTRVVAWLDSIGWTVRDTTDSPILGGDGAREYLLWAEKRQT